MQSRAILKHARMTPRKIRPLAAALRGLSVVAADQQLAYIPGKASRLIRQVLASAVANAITNEGAKADALKIGSISVNEGLKMRRFRPASRGMAHPFTRRTAHITIVVEGAGPGKKAKKREIETITADVYAAEGGKESLPVETVPTPEEPPVDAPRSVETRQDKQVGEAFQKTKMMQQGGNQTKTQKTHRRKAV